MALPTFSQIVQSMLSFLQISRPDIATTPGTVVNDVVVSTVANQLSAQDGTDPSVYSSIQYVQNLQAFVTNAATILPADLDAIANNYGMVRNPGVQATGILTLRIRNYTTSSPIITVPSGTTVSTLSTSSAPAVSFATTATITFVPSSAPAYYNPSSGFYEQSVGIICQTIGTVGNVGANTIVSLVGPGLGIDAVTNTTATSGGTNIESNVQFAAHIQIKLMGNNVGTPNGMLSLVEANPNVIQAIIVGPNDPEMLRNQYGGSVDVYVRGQILVTTNPPETYMYSSTGSQQYVMANQPVISVGLVTGIVGGLPHTFILGTDYNVFLNPNSLYAGSTESASYIQWIPSGTKPDNNTLVSITYTADSLIEILQALFADDSNHIVGSDILVKEAIEASIAFTAGIFVVPGYVPSSVVSQISTNLSVYINALGLGATITLSELVAIIQDTPGVSEVDLTSLILQSTEGAVTTTIPPGQFIYVGKEAYPVVTSLTITVES